MTLKPFAERWEAKRKRIRRMAGVLADLHSQRERIRAAAFRREMAPALYDLALAARSAKPWARTLLWRGIRFRIEHGVATRRVICPVTGCGLVAVLDV